MVEPMNQCLHQFYVCSGFKNMVENDQFSASIITLRDNLCSMIFNTLRTMWHDFYSLVKYCILSLFISLVCCNYILYTLSKWETNFMCIFMFSLKLLLFRVFQGHCMNINLFQRSHLLEMRHMRELPPLSNIVLLMAFHILGLYYLVDDLSKMGMNLHIMVMEFKVRYLV